MGVVSLFFWNLPLTSKSDRNRGALRAIHQQNWPKRGEPVDFHYSIKMGKSQKVHLWRMASALELVPWVDMWLYIYIHINMHRHIHMHVHMSMCMYTVYIYNWLSGVIKRLEVWEPFCWHGERTHKLDQIGIILVLNWSITYWKWSTETEVSWEVETEALCFPDT